MCTKYYIKVFYPAYKDKSANIEYVLKTPDTSTKVPKWSSASFIESKCCFDTESHCIDYIKQRFKKVFNQRYTYFVYLLDSNDKNTLIGTYNVNSF